MSRPRPSPTPPLPTGSTGPGLARISRRGFLAAGLGGLGALGLGLAGCSFGGSSGSPDLGGSTNLRMLTWSDYIDPDENGRPGTLTRAQSELGLTVDPYDDSYADNYAGWEDLVARAVKPSRPGFDIVVPTNWRAAQMIQQGWAEPIPLELVPNHVNLDPTFLTNGWDRGARYQMPWQAGITGIAYDPKLTGRRITSVKDLFDPAFKGRVGFVNEMREAVGIAMLANGADPSRPTVAAAQAGFAKVRDAIQQGQVRPGAVVGKEFADKLNTGEVALTMAWSGDTALLQAKRPDIEFVVPDEGAIQWFDTMVIPRRAANIAAAGRFMNFVYDPANAARITAFVGYISPVLGVQDALRKLGGAAATQANSKVLFPDAATRNRLYTWGGLDDPDVENQLDDAYRQLAGA